MFPAPASGDSQPPVTPGDSSPLLTLQASVHTHTLLKIWVPKESVNLEFQMLGRLRSCFRGRVLTDCVSGLGFT